MILRRLSACALATSLLAAPLAAGAPAVIKLRQGTLKAAQANGVDYFYAIPFAPAPVGDLRWRPPGAAPAWTGERDATKAPPSCQNQEDCLYLNGVRPANA